MAEQFSISVLVKAIDKLSAPFREMGRSIDSLTKPIKNVGMSLKSMGKQVTETSKKVKDVGKDLSLKLTAPIVAFGTASFKASKDFNRAMANVASLIPDNIERVKELKEGVRDLALDLGVGTGEMAEGLYRVVSAFGDNEDTMGRLSISAKAAKAGLSSVAEAIGLVSSVTKGYGDTSAEATRKAADLAFMTVKLGDTDFPQLAASIGKVVPIAAKLGIEQEELFAAFATLTGVTGSASEVSTQLSSILTAMLKPTNEMNMAIEHLSQGQFRSASAMVEQVGMFETVKRLMDLVRGDAELFTEVLGGRKEGLVGAFALAGEQAGEFQRKLGEIENSSGAMEQALRQQTEGINSAGQAWDEFKTRMEIFAQLVGETLSPAVVKVIDVITPWVEKFRNLSEGTKTYIVVIGALVAAIGPLLVVLGTVGAAIGGILTALGTFGIAVPSIAIIGAFAGALTAVAVAIGLVISKWEYFVIAGKWFVIWVKDVIKWLGELVNKIKDFGISGIFESVKGFFGGGLGEFVGNIVYGGNETAPVANVPSPVRSVADVNIRLQAEEGTSASIDNVRQRKGDVGVNLATTGYVGVAP